MPVRDNIASSFEAQGLMKTLGAELLEAADGIAVIKAPLRKETAQQHGFGHAGLTFSIGDSAAGYAALSTLEDGAEVLTSEMKINLLAPAKGDYLLATGKVEKAGRSLIVVTARVQAVTGDARRDIALLQGTIFPLRP